MIATATTATTARPHHGERDRDWIAPHWARWHAIAWAVLAGVTAFAAVPPGWFHPLLLFVAFFALPLLPFWLLGLGRQLARLFGPRRDPRRLALWALPLAYAAGVLAFSRSDLPDRVAWAIAGDGLAELRAEADALPAGLSELPDRWIFPFELSTVRRLPTGRVRVEISGTAWGPGRRGWVFVPGELRDDPAQTAGLEPLRDGWFAWFEPE